MLERGIADAEYRRLLDQHRDAVRAYLARVEREAAQAARWPADRPPEAYIASARLRLEALRADHDARVAAQLDAEPVLHGAALVQAWTRGERALASGTDSFGTPADGVLGILPASPLRDVALSAEQWVQAAATGGKAPPRVASSQPAPRPSTPATNVPPPVAAGPATPPPALPGTPVRPARPPAPAVPSTPSVATPPVVTPPVVTPPVVTGPAGPGWPPTPPVPGSSGQPGGPTAMRPPGPSVGPMAPPVSPGRGAGAAPGEQPNITLRLPPGGVGMPEIDIPWSLPATPFRPLQGMRLTVVCPPGGQLGPVVGTDVYADDSSICTAAAHAGLVTLAAGGRVLIELGAERSAFVGSARHGLVSGSRGAWPASFRVLAAAGAVPPSSPGPSAVAPGPGGRVVPTPRGADPRIEQEIASVGGKYRGLVAVVRGRPPEPHGTDGTDGTDDDEEEEPDVVELGYRRAGTWQGQGSVPAGFWVYAHPHLYVWRELTPR